MLLVQSESLLFRSKREIEISVRLAIAKKPLARGVEKGSLVRAFQSCDSSPWSN